MWMIAVFETLCNWWIWTFGHGAGLLVPPFIVPHCVDILSVVSLCGPQTVSFPACSSVCAAATFLQRCVNQVSSQAWLSAAGMWLSLYLLSRLCPQSLHSHHQSSISPPSSLYMLSRLCSVWTYATLHHPPSSIHPPPSSIFTPGPTNIHYSCIHPPSSPPSSLHPGHRAATDWSHRQGSSWLADDTDVHRQTEPDDLNWMVSTPLHGHLYIICPSWTSSHHPSIFCPPSSALHLLPITVGLHRPLAVQCSVQSIKSWGSRYDPWGTPEEHI